LWAAVLLYVIAGQKATSTVLQQRWDTPYYQAICSLSMPELRVYNWGSVYVQPVVGPDMALSYIGSGGVKYGN